MPLIPKTHPRRDSLKRREALVGAFEQGMVAREGLIAHGRGEALDYLLGERTTRCASEAARAAAALFSISGDTVISVNGNAAALCAEEIVGLADIINAGVEVNLFYDEDGSRRRAVADALTRCGAKKVLGADPANLAVLHGTDSARRMVDRDGILCAETVLVALEDGDRTAALKAAGKKVVAIDLNPLSRTAQTADITIVDELVRAVGELGRHYADMISRDAGTARDVVSGFDNRWNLGESIAEIKSNLEGRLCTEP